MVTRDQFEAIWDGQVVLMARRASLTDLSRRFDITWFFGAIHKYRRLLGEVLVSSFFLQLVALPIAYFQARRVGDSVARVRELENIRQFLTSNALTLVIDLLFTFVFLAVMFYYSPLLTFVVLGAFPFYIAISAGATPLFRRRLDEKFRRGPETQSCLVETITAVETLKAMAVEPQMQRLWEEHLAGYVA